MSKTLFLYILKDLLRIFVITSIVLAGVMSFGGLLKPMTENGLSAAQAGKMLLFFLPATQTYALPIAALFATTMVYGRLASDNEITACRASGISGFALTLPAVVLGLTLAIVSLVSFCFVVPHFMLRAEKVVFSNIAEVVKKKVDRSHQLSLGGFTVYANSAEVRDPPADEPGTQVVVLKGVMFVKYENDKAARRFELPTEFWTAEEATAFIRQAGDELEFVAQMVNGVKITRAQGPQAGSAVASFGPMPVESPIREKTQFMDIRTLKELRLHPEKGRNVREALESLLRQETQERFLRMVADGLNSTGSYVFRSEEGTITLFRGDDKAIVAGDSVDMVSRGQDRQVRLRWQKGPNRATDDEAMRATLHVEAETKRGADDARQRLRIAIDLASVVLDANAGGDPGDRAPREAFRRHFSIPLPRELAAIQKQDVLQYKASYDLKGARKSRTEKERIKELDHTLDELKCSIDTAIHSRASFAVSCLILVIVGCILGMMFKSGDFLTAFAISVAPALLTIALISTGQHVGESGPKSLAFGIALIWSGNAAVLVLASVLLWRLQRQ